MSLEKTAFFPILPEVKSTFMVSFMDFMEPIVPKESNRGNQKKSVLKSEEN